MRPRLLYLLLNPRLRSTANLFFNSISVGFSLAQRSSVFPVEACGDGERFRARFENALFSAL